MIIHPKNVNEFDSIISKGSVLVDFYATWCGPCKMLSPVLEEIEEEKAISAIIVKVDVDELGDVAMRYGIQAVPTIILFKDGLPVAKTMGYQSKESIIEFVQK